MDLGTEGREPVDSPDAADVIVAFVRTSAELDTDVNRDILRDRLVAHGVRPVRRVAVDDQWSALRFRAA